MKNYKKVELIYSLQLSFIPILKKGGRKGKN
jgi:hypothetical protein